MKKIVTLLTSVVLCLGMSMMVFASAVPTANGRDSAGRGYLVQNGADQATLQKIAEAGRRAMYEQLAIPTTADVKLIAAGNYQLYDAKGIIVPSGAVPTGSEKFYFDIPDGANKEYQHGASIYAAQEYSPGKWRIIEGQVVQAAGGIRKMEVTMKQFSPIAFFKVMSNGAIMKVAFGGDGKYIPSVPGDQFQFADVNQGDWYYAPAEFVFSRKIMTGMDNTYFGPSERLSRAQFATILYRMEQSPGMAYNAGAFPDVADGQFYTYSAMWAKSTGVIEGYTDGRFGPADDITREQMAVMMYRYATMRKLDTAARGDLGSFPDGSSVSGFAQEAMKWAVGKGLICGDNGRLNPQGKAERGQCATIIMRYMQGYGL